MIRHRPAGSGHPYRDDSDQRVPVHPVAGEPIELRATTPRSSGGALWLEVRQDRTRRIAAERAEQARSSAAQQAEGHLDEAAQRAAQDKRVRWVARLGPFEAGVRIAYRFASDGGDQTSWHGFVVAGWSDAGGRLALDGPALHPDQRSGGELIAESVDWLIADAGPLRVRFALTLAPGSHVVGFGERFDALDQAGRRLDAIVVEQYKDQGARTYLPMPFAIVVDPDGQAWGLHVRTGRRTWFDVGASVADRLAIEVALDPTERDPEVAVAIYRGTPAEILAAFLAETGPAVRPPDWVFTPWMSGNEWNTQARVRAEVQRSLDEGITVGVLVVEAWSDETTFVAFRDAESEVHPDGSPHRLADFTFPANGAWPDPSGLVDWLHGHDIRLLLWQVPLLPARPGRDSQARADRDTMINRGYAVREADGRPYRNRGWWFPGALLPDWTDPDASAWWLEKRRYLVEDLGIDGFKTDGGEHAWGDDLRYADGSRGDAANNRYPVHYAAAYHGLLRSAGRDPVTFSRAGFTGAAAVPTHWAGDERSTWAAFRASITAGLTAGASGVFFWGWDLAGFSGEIPDPELYLRAAAMATFCPIMQYHSEFNHHRRPSRDRTPWNIAERTGDPRVIPIFRAFARLRVRLVPYLVAQAARSVATGQPLMRALFFDWPSDPRIWEYQFEYLLGDELLVAPVVAPHAETWSVYLPSGDWVDAWTGERLGGNRLVEAPAPIDRIPVYRRLTGEAGRSASDIGALPSRLTERH